MDLEGEVGAEGAEEEVEVEVEEGPCGEGEGESMRWEEAWTERSWATRSEESLAAFTARVRGIMRRVWANSPIASCSREPWVGLLVGCFASLLGKWRGGE